MSCVFQYQEYMDRQMKENREQRVHERIQTILRIKALNLPPDITKGLILTYKYDILEAKWRRRHRVVMVQVRSILVSKHTSGCNMSSVKIPACSRTYSPSHTS